MNTIMPTIGGALGSEIAVSILAGSALAGDLPSGHGHTLAFAVSALSLVVAAVASLLVPKPRIRKVIGIERRSQVASQA